MIITKETDYSLRILRELLDGKKHTIEEITDREMIPKSFAYQILRKLSKAGLIQALRGQGGGCVLSCQLAEVSLYDLMNAVNDKSAIASCTRESHICPWRLENDGCQVHSQLCRLQEKLDEELRTINLQQLLTGEDTAS